MAAQHSTAAASVALSAFNGDYNGIRECVSVTIRGATVTDMHTHK